MKKKLCLLLCILIGIVSVGCGSGSEEKQTEKLLKILVDNKVTPIALDDVLTDLIKVP